MQYTKHMKSRPRPGMVLNNAGGYVYETSGWNRLKRFLVTGSDKGTYYVTERKLTLENAENVLELLKQDPVRVINEAVAVSQKGLAKSNDTALFVIALALTYGDEKTKAYASSVVTQVARTGTHILHLVAMIDDLRSWGRSVRRAIGDWYNQPAERLAYQLAKYQNRDGWSHRDVLRSIHIKPATEEHNRLFRWAVGKYEPETDEGAMRYIYGMKLAHRAESAEELIRIINEYQLEREHIPNRFLNDPYVWAALLPNLKYEALIRNLGMMSACGLLTGDVHPDTYDKAIDYVLNYITNPDNIKKSRIHPMKILTAWFTYSNGSGLKSGKRWHVVGDIVEALEKAFYQSFGNVEPVNKPLLVAMDCSGSMGWHSVATGLSCFEATVALAYITIKTEKQVHTILFSERTIPVSRNWKEMTFREVLQDARDISFMAGTDCSLPYSYALKEGIQVDGIIMYTDEESWMEVEPPVTLLERYREKVNPECRNVVCAMAANHAQLASPEDTLSLDIAGFSADTPQVVSSFLRGEF